MGAWDVFLLLRNSLPSQVSNKMVLGDLGNKIADALRTMNQSVVVDEEVIKKLVNSLAMALLQATSFCLDDFLTSVTQADVDVKLVKQLQENIKLKVWIFNIVSLIFSTFHCDCAELCRDAALLG